MQKNRYDEFLNLLKILEDHMQDTVLCQSKTDRDIRMMDRSLGRHRKEINKTSSLLDSLVDQVKALDKKMDETDKVNRRLERKVLALEVIIEDQATIQEDMQSKIAHLQGRMCNCVARPGVPEVEILVEEMESDEDSEHGTDLSYQTPPMAASEIPPYVDGVRAESVEDISFFDEDRPLSQSLQTCGCPVEEEKVVVVGDLMSEIIEGNKENELPIRIPEVGRRCLLMDLPAQRFFPYRHPKAASRHYPRGSIEGRSRFVGNHI